MNRPWLYAAEVLHHFHGSYELSGLVVETLSNSPEPTSVSNETCIIQHALIDGNGILLTADAGPQALMEAAQYAHTVGRLSPPYTSPLSLI
jgi:hypothetical protein